MDTPLWAYLIIAALLFMSFSEEQSLLGIAAFFIFMLIFL
jgi:hypothetical protein